MARGALQQLPLMPRTARSLAYVVQGPIVVRGQQFPPWHNSVWSSLPHTDQCRPPLGMLVRALQRHDADLQRLRGLWLISRCRYRVDIDHAQDVVQHAGRQTVLVPHYSSRARRYTQTYSLPCWSCAYRSPAFMPNDAVRNLASLLARILTDWRY
jgi:hypothetical protein